LMVKYGKGCWFHTTDTGRIFVLRLIVTVQLKLTTQICKLQCYH
jgi:hypothetical protein